MGLALSIRVGSGVGSHFLSRCFGSKVIQTTEKLSVRDLNALFDGQIAALRVPGFCSDEVVDHAMKKLSQVEIVDYNNAAGVGKFKDIGMAYFEAETPEQRKIYYEKKQASLDAVRQAFSPYLSPIDKIRLAADEAWPHGASLMKLEDETMFVGLIRAIRDQIYPHEDKLDRDDPSTIAKINYIGQFAFNCYLSVPKVGGALHLWDKELDTAVYDKLRGDSYGIQRNLLPAHDISIQPQKGELVIFNGRKLHAVSSCAEKVVRVSVSGFMILHKCPTSGNKRIGFMS